MKIDTSVIDGYESMSAEDKLKALENFNLPDPDYTGYVKKETFDKTASDLAKAKKELSAKMSEEEKKAAETAQAQKDLEEKYNALLHESEVSKSKAKLVALGYDEKLADDTAEALVNGDMEKVFANQKKHQEALEKSIRADALKQTPKPQGGGNGSDTMTLAKLRAMPVEERMKYHNEHPEEYNELYAKGE